jgi:signal transduction histidine kinase
VEPENLSGAPSAGVSKGLTMCAMFSLQPASVPVAQASGWPPNGRFDLSRRRRSILVVEDDHDIRTSLADFLTLEGFEVSTAADGAAALTRLRRGEPPDVVLLDLMMPVMDGWQFRLEQKRDPVLAQVPVIALSANGSPQARAVDAAAFIAKPLDVGLLLSTIDRVIAQALAERTANAERMAALGTLAAGIAHEINNPLCYVIANLQLTLRQLPTALRDTKSELPTLVEEAIEGASRIASIVREIQQVSRASPDEPSIVEVRTVVESVLRLTAHEIKHRARLDTEFEPTPAVQIDRVRLEQVLMNLIVNAIHAIEEGRALENTIRVNIGTSADGRVEIRIADSGCGIPDPAKPRVFDPFFTTKAPGSGTGLGLAISRAIVTAAGGDITFDSREGKGSVFSVLLPPAHPTRVESARSAVAAMLSPLRILAIDDEVAILRSLKRLLEPPHEVVMATAASEVMDLVRARTFDVVLCDLSMPDMPGAELSDRIVAMVPALASRIVFMTGGAFTPRTRALVERGDRLLLEKPFSYEALQSVLQLASGDDRVGS